MSLAVLTKPRPTTERKSLSAFLFQTDLGWMALAFSGDRLERIMIGHPSSASVATALPSDANVVSDERQLPASIRKTMERLQRFAAGEADDFQDIELDLSHLSDFQRRVVNACRRIKAGQAKSYGELAAKAGFPNAARAVGSVMRNNHFPLIVPCHRVIGAGGKLGGFSCPEGLAMKEKLLEREGASIPNRARKAE